MILELMRSRAPVLQVISNGTVYVPCGKSINLEITSRIFGVGLSVSLCLVGEDKYSFCASDANSDQ